jgi:hypothetical protein
MSELGKDARAVVRAGRGLLGPNTADRERIARALRERLDGGFEAPSGGALALTNVATGFAKKGLALVGAVLVVGGVVVSSSGNRLASLAHGFPPARLTVPTVARVEAARPLTTRAVEDTSPPRAVEAPPLDPPSAGARRRSDRLAEEVAILSRAEKEFHAGRPASALQVLEEHRRKFPSGALVQERIAARVHALCALGRTTEAESDLARLERLSPGSLQEGRAREACGPGASP